MSKKALLQTETDDAVSSHTSPDPREEGTSAVQRATAAVRRAIASGMYAPGSTFSLTDLSEQLGMSSIPVREALVRLDAQGLIVLRPGKSAMVAALDANEVRAIYRLRRMLEPSLAARSCNRISVDAFALLDALVTTYGKATLNADERWQVHRDIHLALLTPAASEWDLRILEQLWQASARYTRLVYDTSLSREEEYAQRSSEHRILVEAARSGSPREIRAAVDEHLSEKEADCLVSITFPGRR